VYRGLLDHLHHYLWKQLEIEKKEDVDRPDGTIKRRPLWNSAHYRDDCDTMVDEYGCVYRHKNITKLAIDLSLVVVVDDNPLSYRGFEPNAIRIAPFWGESQPPDNQVLFSHVLCKQARNYILYFLSGLGSPPVECVDSESDPESKSEDENAFAIGPESRFDIFYSKHRYSHKVSEQFLTCLANAFDHRLEEDKKALAMSKISKKHHSDKDAKIEPEMAMDIDIDIDMDMEIEMDMEMDSEKGRLANQERGSHGTSLYKDCGHSTSDNDPMTNLKDKMHLSIPTRANGAADPLTWDHGQDGPQVDTPPVAPNPPSFQLLATPQPTMASTCTPSVSRNEEPLLPYKESAQHRSTPSHRNPTKTNASSTDTPSENTLLSPKEKRKDDSQKMSADDTHSNLESHDRTRRNSDSKSLSKLKFTEAVDDPINNDCFRHTDVDHDAIDLTSIHPMPLFAMATTSNIYSTPTTICTDPLCKKLNTKKWYFSTRQQCSHHHQIQSHEADTVSCGWKFFCDLFNGKKKKSKIKQK
ncbi:hypothetical protein RFI_24543, partial [Reticulomyxa filosa]